MKGIILAGGRATRLYPITKAVCKQLLPVYNKPLIYYPLSVIMLAKIRDILMITTQEALSFFKALFKDGSDYGLNITYQIQEEPRGIAEAFIIGEEFIKKEKVCLILGDNIFYGHDLQQLLQSSVEEVEKAGGAIIFGYYVSEPQRYGIVNFDQEGNVISIEEKPKIPKSNYAVVGLYFYDNQVIEIAKTLKPSWRGELEITDINNAYLERKKLKVKLLGRGYAWLDAGTYDSLLDASLFIKTIEERQGLKIGCIEEIAYRLGYISNDKLKILAEELKYTNYKDYLLKILEE